MYLDKRLLLVLPGFRVLKDLNVTLVIEWKVDKERAAYYVDA